MKKLIILPLFLIYWGCEDEQPEEVDTTPPTVTITSAFAGIVSELVPITVMVNDDSGVEKVELWVDGNFTGITDNTEPFELNWNTVPYQDGTAHVIVIRAYDTSGNTADSVPITLTVDNTGASPSAVTLGASYGDDTVTLLWSKNNDADFSSYKLYESLSEDMSDETLINETEERTDTTYVVTGIDESETRFYQVVVEDVFGLQSVSNIETTTSLIGTYTAIMVLYQANDICYAYDSYQDSSWFFQLTMNTYQEYFWKEDDECWNESAIWSFDMEYKNNMFHTDMFISPDTTLQFEFGWELKGDSLFWYWIDTFAGLDSSAFQCNGDYWDPVSVPYIIALRDDVIDFSPLCDTTSRALINSRRKLIELNKLKPN